MLDCFAILEQPRLPSLDLEKLKQQYLRLSAQAHPDKAPAGEKPAAQQLFTRINTAYQTLRDTRARLLHLLALEGRTPPPHIQQPPPEVIELFQPVATLTRETDAHLASKPSSPILQAQHFQRSLHFTDRLQALLATLHERIQTVENQLRSDPPPSLDHLEHAALVLGFYQRWQAQLQQRLAALAL